MRWAVDDNTQTCWSKALSSPCLSAQGDLIVGTVSGVLVLSCKWHSLNVPTDLSLMFPPWPPFHLPTDTNWVTIRFTVFLFFTLVIFSTCCAVCYCRFAVKYGEHMDTLVPVPQVWTSLFSFHSVELIFFQHAMHESEVDRPFVTPAYSLNSPFLSD